jgi:hypothetical protein
MLFDGSYGGNAPGPSDFSPGSGAEYLKIRMNYLKHSISTAHPVRQLFFSPDRGKMVKIPARRPLAGP